LLLCFAYRHHAKDRFLFQGVPPFSPVRGLYQCDQHQEIAASWRSFQGVYDYERIRDWENGEHTFLSDETTLVPFGYTYETWCFDRNRPEPDGDYPIIFWDHETRQARDAYPDFSRWFAGEIESYLFG
ncbi:MAG: hypothetical protein M3Y81_29355, partial [Chloroflexota bacterium]|nr:hypothetical protein [Chloroflexota bacterium]